MVHEFFVIGSGFAVFRLLGHLIFRIALPRAGIIVASIAEDIILLFVYGAFIIARLHIIGLDPSSLLTTSAIMTAVLAFAMQDTLGNILGGVALQLDNSLQLGDWVKLDDRHRQGVSRSAGVRRRSRRATANWWSSPTAS